MLNKKDVLIKNANLSVAESAVIGSAIGAGLGAAYTGLNNKEDKKYLRNILINAVLGGATGGGLNYVKNNKTEIIDNLLDKGITHVFNNKDGYIKRKGWKHFYNLYKNRKVS